MRAVALDSLVPAHINGGLNTLQSLWLNQYETGI